MNTSINQGDNAIDHRSERRQDLEERLIIQVNDARMRETLSGATLSCLTGNCSRHGLRIRTPVQLAAGAHIDLWIKVKGRAKTFLLGGEVRWSRPDTESDAYYSGIRVTSAGTGDLGAWQEFVTNI